MWVLFALLAALLAGISVVLSKAGLKNIDSYTAFAIQSVFILIVSWSAVVFKHGLGKLSQLDRKTWIFLSFAGVLTCLSSLSSVHSLKIGHASRTSSLGTLSLVFSILFAVIFLKDKINWQLIVGGLLMAGGAVFIAFSDR
jgi:bacterial/archaeal transporter family protein